MGRVTNRTMRRLNGLSSDRNRLGEPGVHFSALRLIILFGWFRLFVRREFTSIEYNLIDKLIIIYTCVGFINYVVLWGTLDAFKNQLGFAYNVLGIYFLFRFLLKDFNDIESTIKILGLALIPLAGFMIVEMFSGDWKNC